MHRYWRHLILGSLLAIGIAACSGDDGLVTTTSTSEPGERDDTVTTLPAASDTEDADADTAASVASSTTTTVDVSTTAEFSVPSFTIVSREPGDEGDTVVVLLDEDSYESLTDIDLQNVLAAVVEEFPPVFEAHVVDSEEVVDLVTAESLDSDAQQLLDVHYLVRLEDGFRIRYLGQYEASGVSILGS